MGRETSSHFASVLAATFVSALFSGAPGFGGTMRKMPSRAKAWEIGSEFLLKVRLQNNALCEPVGHFGSTFNSKTASLSSLVICTSDAVTFSGKPISLIVAVPSNDSFGSSLQTSLAVCPGLTETVSILPTTTAGPTSRFASWDETQTVPPAYGAVASRAIFQARGWASPVALR